MENINIFTDINNDVRKLLTDKNLSEDFLNKILNESDWGFIIKISALLESASTFILTKLFGYIEIENEISFMEYANIKSGKLALMKSLGIISKEQFNALMKLAEFRNRAVHKIEDINFSFLEMIQKFDKNQKKGFVENFGRNLDNCIQIGNKKIEKSKFVLENPKICIYFTVLEILACIYLEKEKKDMQDKLTIHLN